MTIGERIKQVRKENKLTQTAFAERVRVSFGSVSKLERGVKAISNKKAARHLMNCSMALLSLSISAVSPVLTASTMQCSM